MSQLSPRAETLLKSLVERYIADGAPVGSRTLAKHAGLDVSPATVRNVMADLEELGLVCSPHTSAGRVPTQLGYRVFVDTLLKVRPLDMNSLRKLEGELAHIEDPQQLITTASDLLSQITQYAAVVLMVPRTGEKLNLRQIEFVNLSGNRVLVILVTQDGQVQNRVVHTERPFSEAELAQAANYFNETYAGLSLGEVKKALLDEMQRDSETMQQTMRVAMQMAQKMLSESNQDDDLVIRGESNLMEIPDLGDVQKLRKLFDAFDTKRGLLHLLDQSMRNPGVKIFIGSESGYEPFEDCSVVTASYRQDDEIVGTLGVVGPTRMPYEHVIPIVDVTARLVSGALSLESR